MSKLDICADLLSLSEYEKIIYDILIHEKGSWIALNSIVKKSNFTIPGLNDIYVCYVDMILDEPGFELILFCDHESMEMLSASYNKSLLFDKIEHHNDGEENL